MNGKLGIAVLFLELIFATKPLGLGLMMAKECGRVAQVLCLVRYETYVF